MRRSVDADKLMDGLGRLATDTDLCKRYGNCTPWIPYSAVRKLISDMILEAKESCDDAVSRKAMLEKIRSMQTYKLFSGDDMILIDKAEVQTELMMLPPTESEPSQVARDLATILANEKDMRVIATQPDIIRCKDCKWYGRADKRRFYRGMDCLQKRIDTIVPDRDFCSRAERREDG